MWVTGEPFSYLVTDAFTDKNDPVPISIVLDDSRYYLLLKKSFI